MVVVAVVICICCTHAVVVHNVVGLLFILFSQVQPTEEPLRYTQAAVPDHFIIETVGLMILIITILNFEVFKSEIMRKP